MKDDKVEEVKGNEPTDAEVEESVEELVDPENTQAELVENTDEDQSSAAKESDEAPADDPHKIMKQAGLKGWYVIHTYAGYEDQVVQSLDQRIESLGMKDKIFNVLAPKEKQIEIKNGKRRVVEKRIFPGYVFVEMIVTDEAWYVVRNTPNVTGFIGTGVQPTPVSADEIVRIKKRMGVEEPKYKIELKENDLIRIVDGPLKGFEAKVTEIDEDKGRVKVLVSMFGRETPVTLDFLQVKKI